MTLRATYQAILGEIAAQDRWAFPLVTACDGYVSYDLRFMSPTALDDTATLWTYPNVDPRTLPHFKGPDFPIQKSLREQAQSHGANEAVLLGADGVVREGAFSAIVHWVDGTLVLAPRDGRMPSVTEELVTEIAREKGIQVVVRGASPCEVASADEVWCLSSLHGIRVVTAWDAMPVRHAGIAEDFRTALRAKEVAISTLREIGITPMLERCRVLLVDNYDSFTYNLAHLVAACTGKEPHVVRNDTELDDIDLDRYTHIIFSPGPGSPEEGADVGICAQILEVATVPILGVCLGHQLIAHICGARIERAPQPMHGRRSTVRHQGEGLFEGVPKDFQVVRYHSLAATSLPSVLQMSAVSDDGVVMAFRHRERSLWGVQFHPESILTEYGATILRNFLSMPTTHSLASEPPHAGTQLAWHCEQGFPSEQRIGNQDREGAQGDDTAQASECSQDHESALAEAAGCEPQPVLPHIPAPTRTWRIERRHPGLGHDPETIFRALYGADHHSFWLDSNSGDQRCQLSIMGSCDGKYAHTLRYQAGSGNTLCETSDGRTQKIAADIFTLIHTTLAAYGTLRKESSVHGFMLGYVGYLGYGLKGDTCGVADPNPSVLPDAYVTFVERAVVFDHVSGDCILMALHSGGDDPDLDQATIQWCNETEQKIAALASAPPAPSKPLPYPPHEQVEQVFTFRHNRQAYLGLIDHCKELIAAGQTYEVCLTNMVTYPHSLDPLETYRRLRTQARVPFGALLRCGTYSVLSASPERFLSVDTDGHVAASPIKGTRPRSHNPQEDEDLRRDLKESEKDRAENLMIVDLLRNDLSIVCEPGSVQVPCLFDVESYPSVHQLVSTVTGRLRSDASTIDCVRAAFPGGSMTGAPKIRTLEIIDTLEGGPRGIYSGAIGWFSPNGAADLSIVIRTLVVERTQATFGVGGAITHLSVPECEWEETLVKARTIASSILQ